MATRDRKSTAGSSAPRAAHRLGYLLKHAALRYEELTTSALEPLGIGPRAWAALNCLDESHGLSQREVAALLGVDRTTMVALIDELQAKALVERRPHPGDRRKNVVGMTELGRNLVQRGAGVLDDCEQQFLAVLGRTGAEHLKRALDTVVEPHPDPHVGSKALPSAGEWQRTATKVV